MTEAFFEDAWDYPLDEYPICQTCWGEGSGEECEMMSDWINYGRDWVLCPVCKGTGRLT